jgi:short-subunit dehydrogenase
MSGLDRLVAADWERGIIVAEAGLTLAELIRLALPRGWFPPVVPGTKFVTLGGAVANDVHGKNHHVRGTFGRHVRSLTLYRSDAGMVTAAPQQRPELFAATVGGLGLTGIILTVELQLRPVRSAHIEERRVRFRGLDEFFELAAAHDQSFEYTAAWIDCLASGRRFARGYYMAGNHALAGGRRGDRSNRLSIPLYPPFSLINPLTLRAFNAAVYHRQSRRPPHSHRRLRRFLFPLDSVNGWNRMYGRAGFQQYRCAWFRRPTPGHSRRPAGRLRSGTGLVSRGTQAIRHPGIARAAFLSYPGLSLAGLSAAGGRNRRAVRAPRWPAAGCRRQTLSRQGRAYERGVLPAGLSGVATDRGAARPAVDVALLAAGYPMTQNVLVIGANSAIAQAVARHYAENGARLFLCARSAGHLEAVAADLRARGAVAVGTFVTDADDSAGVAAMQRAAWEALGTVHVALVAFGSLPEQQRAASDTEYLKAQFRTNAESVLVCLAGLAQRFIPQRSGVIAVIGSVAGDRGRPGNYLYGSAKAAIDAFASGLRAQLYREGVHVLTIKPGFVATPMTAHLQLPARLTAQPAAVAARITRAIDARQNVVYGPGFV